MKKLLFFFAVSLLLCNATSELFSMEETPNNDPVRIRFSSKLFRRDKSFVFTKLTSSHFLEVSDKDEDKSARGRREIFIDHTDDLAPLLNELRQARHIYIKEDLDEVVEAKVKENNRNIDERLAASKALGKIQGFEEAYDDVSWIQRHQKLAVVSSFAAGGAIVGTVWAVKTWWDGRQ